MPHLHGSLVGDVERVPHLCLMGLLQGVDPRVATARGRNVLRGNVVAKVPVLCMLLAICALRWQADHRKNTDGEEAAAVVAPEILRQVVCQGGGGCHCVPGHRGGLVVHHKMDQAPQEIWPMGPRSHESKRLRDAAVPFLASRTRLCAQSCQIDTCLVPHVGVEIVQGWAWADEVRRPERLEDVVGDLPDFFREGSQRSRPVLAVHGRCHLAWKHQEGCLQGLHSPLPV